MNNRLNNRLKRMECNLAPTPIRPAIYQQFRGCKWKKRHISEPLAARAVERIKENGADSNPNRILTHYRCDICFGWHVGHIDPPRISVAPRPTAA